MDSHLFISLFFFSSAGRPVGERPRCASPRKAPIHSSPVLCRNVSLQFPASGDSIPGGAQRQSHGSFSGMNLACKRLAVKREPGGICRFPHNPNEKAINRAAPYWNSFFMRYPQRTASLRSIRLSTLAIPRTSRSRRMARRPSHSRTSGFALSANSASALAALRLAR